MRKIILFGTLATLSVLPVAALTACNKKEATRCSYRIEAEYLEGTLNATVCVSVVNGTQNTLEKIPFALYGNAFSEEAERPVSELFSSACYYDGESYGGMEIHSVEGAVSYDVTSGGSILTAYLSEPLYPDECVTLTLDYTLTLAKANHRLGVGENCVNLSYFYPMLFAQNESGFYEYKPTAVGDPFVLPVADFSVSLTVPREYTVACGGEATRQEEGEKAIYSYEAKCVRDAAFVLGHFEKSSAVSGGVQVEYYYFGDEDPAYTMQAALDALATYTQLFGEYPYEKFAFAETDLYLGGMEYSSFITISSLLQKTERVSVVAHEAAHQWWYAVVANDQNACAWQDEGLSEYSVALFYEHNPDYQKTYRDLITASEGAYRNYYSIKSQLSSEVDTSMSRPLSSFSGDYEYRILAYDKGVVLFDRLRFGMGDRRFFAALKRYVSAYAFEVASEADLIGCFSSQEELILSFTQGRCVI